MRLQIKILPLIFLLFVTVHSSALSQEALPDLVGRIKPSVVAIVCYDSKGEKLGQGSGFFIAPNRIVTNRHVIEGASKVHVSNGKAYPVKGILAVDGAGDIALLEVEEITPVHKALVMSQMVPREGESVVVIGSPLGLEGSVSNGIVSAVRELPVSVGLYKLLRLSRLVVVEALL